MRGASRSRRREPPRGDPDVDSALDALSAEELRALVRDMREALDDELRGALLDSVIARAAKGSAGWKPSGPSARVVTEITRFAEAARQAGYADPADVDARLRQGTKAFLAGEHAVARAVFEALLLPIADAEIDLGQHEMVDEVLTIDTQECAAQCVASVYLTTPLEGRARAVFDALDAVWGAASFWAPIEAMERAATSPLPQLDAFLPRWVERLEEEPVAEDAWDRARDWWLREAVLRLEGVAGLERIARKTRRPEALWAWCEALVERREWAEALRAYEETAVLAGGTEWKGAFLDGAALAARELGRPDAAKRLEAAWLGAASLVRLLRWLGAASPKGGALVRRANDAKARCPARSGRQLGLLHLLTGDLGAAAKLLAKAPGLGWSSQDHPGHVVFPAFAGLLAEGSRSPVSAKLLAGLREQPRDPWEGDRGQGGDWGDRCDGDDGYGDDGGDGEAASDGEARKAGERPALPVPSVAEILARAPSRSRGGTRIRAAMLEVMQVAAERRVEGILGNKRRRHYGHAALLMACCLDLAPGVGRGTAVAEWVAKLRGKYARFHAFQEECRRALASVGEAAALSVKVARSAGGARPRPARGTPRTR